jgi:hypothetical protein
VGQEEELFLDITEPVWTPASPSEAKVVGQHTFPFSITIPRDVKIAPVPKAAPKSIPLPPTFSERASPAYIDYRLFVTVRRGRLRVNKQCVPPSPSHSLAWQHFRLTDGNSCATLAGCRRTLRSFRALWRNRHLLRARERMLKVGWSLARTRIPKAGRFMIPSRSQGRSSVRVK